MEEKLWHKSYAEGVKKTLEYEKVTISNALSRSAKRFPDNTALNYMGKKITYGQLDRLVNTFARALQDLPRDDHIIMSGLLHLKKAEGVEAFCKGRREPLGHMLDHEHRCRKVLRKG